MCILSLDISTASTGWCITSNGCLFTLGNIVVDSKLSTSVKLCLFAEELESILIKYSPTHIVQEDIFSGKNYAFVKGIGYITKDNYYINGKYFKRENNTGIELDDNLIKLMIKMKD